MRTFFVVCFVGCTLAVTAPMATEAEVLSAMTLTASNDLGPTARPTEVIVAVTPAPTPKPTAAPPSKPLIFTPKRVVPAVKPAPPPPTVAPTPKATATPAPKPATEATPTPKPRPKPTSTPSGTTYTRDQVIAGIRSGWSGDDSKAVSVADCESSLNPRATSPGGTYLGLWQFHIETWRNYGGTGDPRDHSPQTQTQVAWQLFLDHGWSAWPGCS